MGTPAPPAGAQRAPPTSPIRASVCIRPPDPATGSCYEISEPELTARERKVYRRWRSRIFDGEARPFTEPGVLATAEELSRRLDGIEREEREPLEPGSVARLRYHLGRNLVGFGIIDPMMRDPEIEDISCDGVGIPIFVHHRRFGSLATNRSFSTDEELDRAVTWLAQRSGRHLSRSRPLLEGTLPGGARLTATLGREITPRGSSFTIRRFRESPLTPIDLVRLGTMSAEMMAFLWLNVEAGRSFVVGGGTASGKTTTLNAVLLFLPSERKVVSIEDTRELHLARENWVPLTTRTPPGASSPSATTRLAGEIDMFDLLTAALRQRPQFLAVGEVRGPEAYIVFQAMATGKSCATTFHAESVAALVRRMENPPISVPRGLIAAVDFVLLQRQVRVAGAPVRRAVALTEIIGLDPETEELVTHSAFQWDSREDSFRSTGQSPLLARLARDRGVSISEVFEELDRRAEWLRLQAEAVRAPPADAGGESPSEVAEAIARYVRDPNRALRTLRERVFSAPALRL